MSIVKFSLMIGTLAEIFRIRKYVPYSINSKTMVTIIIVIILSSIYNSF